MKKWTIALACLAVLAAPSAAHATDQDKFEKAVGKFAGGLGLDGKQKGLCVCFGGLFDTAAGRLSEGVFTVSGKQSVLVQCIIRRYNNDGSFHSEAGCLTNGGTGWTVLAR